MVGLSGIYCGVLFCVLAVASGQHPCNSISDYILEFSSCYAPGRNDTGLYFNIIYANMIGRIPGYENFTSIILQSLGLDETDLQGEKACSDGIDQIRTCMNQVYENCTDEIKSALSERIDEYRGRLCVESQGIWQWSDLTIYYFDLIGNIFSEVLSNFESCVGAIFVADNDECTTSTIGLTSNTSVFAAPISDEEAIDSLTRTYEAYFKCLYRNARAAGCTGDSADGFLAMYVIQNIAPGVRFGLREFDALRSVAEKPTGPVRITVAVFGDPHLLSLVDGQLTFTTCSAVGQRTYLLNNHIQIYGINTAVTGWNDDFGLPATYMTEVTVLLMAEDGRTVLATYFGSGSASLSSTFEGGSTSADSEQITLVERGSAIQIYSKRTGILVVIKRLGYTLAMKVRMEESLYASADGDLVFPCPGERLNAAALVADARRKRASSSQICSDPDLEEEEAISCEYDSIYGDSELVDSTYSSLREMDEIIEELDDEIIITDDSNTSEGNDGSSAASFVLTRMAVNLMIILTSGMLV